MHPIANMVEINGEIGKLIIMHEVIPETVRQYTGLTDRNGRKIFEGDILEGFGATRWLVVYDHSAFYCIEKPNGVKYPIEETTETVIGNIHDSPERWIGHADYMESRVLDWYKHNW